MKKENQPGPDQPVNPEHETSQETGPNMFDDLEAEAQDLEPEPPGQEKEEKPKIPTAAIAAGAFQTTFNVLAPAWEVKQHECFMLAEAWEPILDKYLPGILDSVWGAAITSTLLVIGPRLGKPTRHKPKPKPQQQDNQGQQVNDAPNPQQQFEDQYGYNG